MSRTGHFRWAIWTGWTITTLGTGLLLQFGTHTSTGNWASILCVIGFGHRFLLSALGVAAQAAADPKDAVHAVAMYTFMRTLGMVIGVAIGSSICQNQLPGYLEDAGVPITSALEVGQNAAGYVTVLQTMPMASSYRQAIVGAYAQALRVVFGVLTGISTLEGLVSLAMRHHDMDRELDSEHVFRREADGLNRALTCLTFGGKTRKEGQATKFNSIQSIHSASQSRIIHPFIRIPHQKRERKMRHGS